MRPVNTLRQAAILRLRAWAARRHGRDTLPIRIRRRRIYIVPSRFGIMLALVLLAMLIGALNYNSNLGLAFAFLLVSLALVVMHHCHRNLLGLGVDVRGDTDAFAGGDAGFDFVLHNDSRVDRCEIEIHCTSEAQATGGVAANSHRAIAVPVPVRVRGIVRLTQFELRTRYPFGWFRAWTYVQGTLTAFVAPAPGGDRALASVAAAGGTAAKSDSRGDEDFAGLRDYEAGVPLKHMAWKVLARGGEAKVRSYSSLAAQPQWLEWSALEGLDVEARLSQLCRWVLESDAAQRPYGLRVPGRQIAPARGLRHRHACLRALATYGLGAAP